MKELQWSLSGKQHELEIDFFLALGDFGNRLLQLNTFIGSQFVERASRARDLDISYVREGAGGGPTQCQQARRALFLN